ncbi:AEC family transporter, partial [Burkholderia gladioli]|nr:AEC family transporter [Burkholderia gladioli]
GALVSAAHVAPPASVWACLRLGSGAASPCALVSLGLFLAEKRPAHGVLPDALLLTAIKLVVQPALTWWLSARVFGLPPVLVAMAVVLAALPTGTGPFMLAEFYRREPQVTSRIILFSTVASIATLSMLLILLPRA